MSAHTTLTASGPIGDGEVFVTSGFQGFPVRVTNDGATDLASATVIFRLSHNDRLDASDMVLGSSYTGTLAAGATVPMLLSGGRWFRDPGFTGLSGRRVIAVINPGGLLPESDTTDNIAVPDPLP